MKSVLKFILLFLILIHFSCTNKKRIIYSEIKINKKNFISKVTYVKKGNITIEEILNKDSINDGYYKKWVGSKLISVGNYESGKKKGAWFYMNLMGDTVRKENWFLGKQFGEQIEYFKPDINIEKNTIQKYAFFSLEEKELFKMEFDTNKNIIEIHGIPLYTAFNKNKIDRDGIFELICFFGVPKGYFFKFLVKAVESQTRKIVYDKKIESNSFSPDLFNLQYAKKFELEKHDMSAGNYIWKINLSLRDSVSNKIIVDDSLAIDLSVRK